ncbi:MAG: bifunctional diguanylate cyclase/phosphodiesterase, partial [Cyanobacteria bacterium P01_D01_bin.36]
TKILSALNILALELSSEEQLSVIGDMPSWVQQEFEHLQSTKESFAAEMFSPFLSNFLIDAEIFWETPSSEILRSGLWTEAGQSGKEIKLEAIALQLGSSKIVLIESSDLVGDEKFQWLQAARERQLNFASQQKESNDQLFNATFYDPLTKLPNRSLFSSQLETFFEESQWKKDHKFAVVVFDINRFQMLNNSLGTNAGDQVLITVAKRLCEGLRKPNIPVRFGSDEFGLLLSHIESAEDITHIVERLLSKIRQPLLINGHKTNLSASAGIAISEDWYQNSRDLLRDANLALQQAKRLGRGQYCIFDREMRTKAFELWNLESDLRAALEQDQLQLCYQPIVSIETQRIERFEALLRWQHPEHGWISPGKFIPLAEESGLILDIDTWVLKTACNTIQQWQERTGQIGQINVNISPQHFAQGDLLDTIRQAIAPLKASPTALCLEITESSLLSKPKDVMDTLNQLRALGIKIAIDDFGTGYASLSYLQDLPLDMLKIDGYFIKMMQNNSLEIVQTIIELGHKLGFSITAEQVETIDQYRTLQQLGCDTVQGFLFSKPVPIIDAQSLLNAEVIISR